MRVSTLAAAIVPEDIFDAFKEVKEAPEPLNDVAVSNPDEELKVKFDPDFGLTVPVAAVANIGKHVVSDDSSAIVIAEPATAPNDSTPAPSVIRACPLLP